MKLIFAVSIGRDNLPRVVSANVLSETPQFYTIDRSDAGAAFGYRSRPLKRNCETTPEGALLRYVVQRERDRDNALAVVKQAEAQIDVARVLLQSYKSATTVDAVATPVDATTERPIA